MQTAERIPTAGLRALLGNSLDYAGLFPPADLPLEKAVRNFARYETGPDAWFLARFVCPVERLNDLGPYMPLFAKSAPLALSGLALPIPTWRELIPKVEKSLDLIFRFQHSHPERVRVDSIEVALPADMTGLTGRIEIQNLVPAAAEAIELSGLAEITPFFEVTAPDWSFQANNTIRSIAKHNGSWTGTRCRPAAFKLRTGGVKAEAFPTVDQITFAIRTCLDARVAFKCTAGLHHPVRRYDQSLATRMHGFLNILGAAALVHARELSRNDLPSILQDEDASHFLFDDREFAWNGARAGIEQIQSARRDLILSFGSCSFDEPLEDMRKQGIL